MIILPRQARDQHRENLKKERYRLSRMRAHPVHGRVAAWAPVVEAAGHGFGERIVTGPGDEEDEQGEGVAAASVAASQDPRGDARL